MKSHKLSGCLARFFVIHSSSVFCRSKNGNKIIKGQYKNHPKWDVERKQWQGWPWLSVSSTGLRPKNLMSSRTANIGVTLLRNDRLSVQDPYQDEKTSGNHGKRLRWFRWGTKSGVLDGRFYNWMCNEYRWVRWNQRDSFVKLVSEACPRWYFSLKHCDDSIRGAILKQGREMWEGRVGNGESIICKMTNL